MRKLFLLPPFLAALALLWPDTPPAAAQKPVRPLSRPVAPRDTIYRLWPQCDLYDAAAAFASRLTRKQSYYARFVSFQARTPETRLRALQGLAKTINGISTSSVMCLPQFVPGCEGALAWFDLSQLRELGDEKGLAQLVIAWERLGELGSGRVPFHEPYSHVDEETDAYEITYETQEYGYYVDRYGRAVGNEPGPGLTWKTTRTVQVPTEKKKAHKTHKVALSPALNKASAIGLAALTRSNFPLFDYRWFVTNALAEPRYHELLGLDETEESVFRLADIDEVASDAKGATTRAAILASEVGESNRFTERKPTSRRYGRGSFHKSFDYLRAIRVDDVLKDVLRKEAAANEEIWTLPNGLQGFSVQVKGKRVDKADADIAQFRRGGWHDQQVRTAFMCMDCHERERGWIPPDDAVREMANHSITLAVRAAEKEDKDRGRRIRQKYLSIDFNELIAQDQVVFEAAVLAATTLPGVKGMSCAEARREVIETIRDYLQTPVEMKQLAFELGVTYKALVRCIEASPGVDHVLVGLRTGQKQRRDQTEVAMGQIATLLYKRGNR